MLPIKRIDHIAMASPDIAARAKFFQDLFGMKVLEDYGTPPQGFAAIELSIPGSDTKIEILEPSGEDSFVRKFLEQKGSMYHHATFEVTDIREAARVLREYGIEPYGYNEDAEWARELFIHPRDSGGVLLQLFQPHPVTPEAPPNSYLYKLDRPLARPQIVDELAAFPGQLRDALAPASPRALTRKSAPGDWSAFETLLHLRDATLVYAMRFRRIVFQADPFLPDYDENGWVANTLDGTDDVAAILDEIAASRAGLVRVLNRLDDQAWLRTGRHAVAGPVVLEHYARHQVVHEADHLAQVRAALG